VSRPIGDLSFQYSPATVGLDQTAFADLVEPYRREIQLHCYRMLGSLHDAEDHVQETFLRAWRGLDRFEGRASFRNWLYRISTNACLNTIARRPNLFRALPETLGPPAEQPPEGEPATEIAWLEPYPDAAIEGIADAAPGPEARYELRESVQLAFIAAIQYLPPRQRAVLLLRDVLGWSASETAEMLETSIAATNSALQRARATLHTRLPRGRSGAHPLPDDEQRALLDRYVQAWEGADIDAFAALLREDAVFSMPPWPQWYRGRAAIREFITWSWRVTGGDFRLAPTAANRQPAFALYCRDPEGRDYQPHGIWLLTLDGDGISGVTAFFEPRLFTAFAVPPTLSAADPD
jgi:RNA polymerase sigma-70 factor (ECF subfamily)